MLAHLKNRRRTCYFTNPRCKGSSCPGPSSDSRICNKGPCGHCFIQMTRFESKISPGYKLVDDYYGTCKIDYSFLSCKEKRNDCRHGASPHEKSPSSAAYCCCYCCKGKRCSSSRISLTSSLSLYL